MIQPQSAASQGKGRVLVIDDEPDIRESLEILLNDAGYLVDLAQNGRKASSASNRAAMTSCSSTS